MPNLFASARIYNRASRVYKRKMDSLKSHLGALKDTHDCIESVFVHVVRSNSSAKKSSERYDCNSFTTSYMIRQ